MSRRKGRRGAAAAQPAKDAPPRDPTLNRGKRPAATAYHLEDEYTPRWFDPKLSEKPDIDHQIQSVCFAFDKLQDEYKQMCRSGDLDPANAEFRLRGMLDTIRTLKWLKEHKSILKAAGNEDHGRDQKVAQMGVSPTASR